MRWHLEVHNLILRRNFLIVVCWVNGSSDQRLFIENIIDILEESLRGAFRTISSVTDENCIILAQSEENDADRLRGFLEIGLNICDKAMELFLMCMFMEKKLDLKQQIRHTCF